MTTEEIRNQFEKESGQNWWTAPNWYDPICNSIKVFASWEYQEWLEKKLLSLQNELYLSKEQNKFLSSKSLTD